MTLPEVIETLDPTYLAAALLATILLALIAVIAAFRLRAIDTTRLHEALRASEAELREAWGRATGNEALAQERKSEIDRLNGDLSKLRLKLDADTERAELAAGRISRLSAQLESALQDADATARRHAETMAELRAQTTRLRDQLDTAALDKQDLTGTINRLQAELRAQKDASDEKIEILSKVRADMEAKFHELAREALKVQGEEFSKANIERLSATLTPLKEHVGHFEREL
ncbi:MAG: hypothetical protein JJU07_13760, partial [Natronohydrobacter sp.]|nr:hypothetical protein [Natronohydrobacter sp.]